MISKEILISYVKLWEFYSNNKNVKFSNEQLNLISLVNKTAQSDLELNNLLREIVNSDDKIKIIEQYYAKKEEKIEEKEEENEIEVISETFGIDISNIQHKFLSNNKEIFCFYNNVTGRKIILENKKTGVSLVEQLKEIQAQNQIYQTTGEKNAEDILKDKRLKENCELSLIAINELDDHVNEIKKLTKEDYAMLMFLINNANYLKIDYINIENLIGVDKYGKIYEVYVNNENKLEIAEANNANYNDEKVNVSDKIDDNYNKDEQNIALRSNYDDNPTEEKNLHVKIDFDYLSSDLQERIIAFYENPELLDLLSQEEKEKWNKYIEIYKKKLEQQNNTRNKPKVKEFKKEEGFISSIEFLLLICVLVTITISVIICVNL